MIFLSDKTKKIFVLLCTGVYFFLLMPGVMPLVKGQPFEVWLIPFLMMVSLLPYLITQAWIEELILKIKTLKLSRLFLKHKNTVIFTLALMIPLIVYAQILRINWGTLDDHEIFFFLGNDLKLGFNEIFSTLFGKTEVGQIGAVVRFRPVYYFLRIVQTMLLGDQVRLWYFSRWVLIAFSIPFIYDLLKHAVGRLNSGLMICYLFTFTYLTELFNSLGPSEAYVFLGLAIFIWSYDRILRFKDYSFLTGLVTLLGVIICVGSKENMLLLILPLLYLLRHIKSWKWHTVIWYSLSILFSGVVLFYIVKILSVTQADVYSRSIDPVVRISTWISKTTSGYSGAGNALLNLVALVLLFGLLTFLLAWLSKQAKIQLKSDLTKLLLSGLLLIGLITSQQYFYNFSWPVDGRYDFPGMLYIPAAWVILYSLLTRVINKLNFDGRFKLAFSRLFSIALLLAILIKGYGPVSDRIETRINQTTNFKVLLNRVLKTSRANPDTPLVFETYTVGDFEAISSFERYLYAYDIQNPVYLRLHNFSPENAYSDLTDALSKDLVNLSEKGNGQFFHPINELPQNNHCISFFLSQDPADQVSLKQCNEVIVRQP